MQRQSKNSQKSSLRIIGGQWRGRKLSIADAEGLRPTGDRVRETLFNWLAPWLPGARCLDLFAGTGALGLEALSRGAAHTTFIETNPHAAATLREHLNTLDCKQADVLRNDGIAWLNSAAHTPYDIIFVDPPFAKDLWEQALTSIERCAVASAQALVYIETPVDHALNTPPNWQPLKSKTAGKVRFGLWQVA
ncbi:16S rRNA (guanine(966)-N(2))-methyltransferase RsmD [Teredinibacter turnerae]|uniref:16S rRNA (guanine(966)-N(2))-methyltransferase RsmD n=1 Tax=Teredinibacter turnerae TaxID=2426 RepID=UPI000367C429|nr:16S rRNA (guanine(966)-N(2))-methyltransferase RsmD [Teredinibacter turnerae]